MGRPIQIKNDGTREDLICTLPSWPCGSGRYCFGHRHSFLSNVGSAHDVSILELAQTVAMTLNPQTEIRVAREVVAGAGPLR